MFFSKRNLVLVVMLVCGASYAAEISYEGDTNALWIVGQIERGDADKFQKLVSRAPRKEGGISVKLASSGGDVIEAMRIGRQLRDLFIPASESTTSINGNCASIMGFSGPTELEMRGSDSCGCHSACFVVWAGSPYRTGGSIEEGGPDGIGIHRPRFDRSYFAGLSAAEAETEYKRLTDLVMQYFRDMGVPDEIAQKMFAVSSGEIQMLSDAAIKSLESPPAIAEWFASKCGEISKGDQSDYDSFLLRDIQGRLDSKDYLSETDHRHYELLRENRSNYSSCKIEAIKTEQSSRR